MTEPATIQPVPRPRGVLPAETLKDLAESKDWLNRAEANYKEAVQSALIEGSFSEVSKATGLSTNTLQRWKREAGR